MRLPCQTVSYTHLKLAPGDELLAAESNFKLVYLGGNTARCKTNPASGTYNFVVVRSGNRNQLNKDAGVVLGLTDPMAGRVSATKSDVSYYDPATKTQTTGSVGYVKYDLSLIHI